MGVKHRTKPRRRFGRRHRRRGARIPKQMSTQPIATRYITKLKYMDTFNITLNAAGVGIQQFRLNSLYDPDFTGVGHQPYGFDQLAVLYSHYRVFGCNVKFTLIDVLDSASNEALYMGIYSTNVVNALAASTISEICELPFCKYRVTSANTLAGGTSRTLIQHIPRINKVMGISSLQYSSDDLFFAPVTADPTGLLYGNCFILDPSLTLVGKDVKIGVELIMHAELMFPKVLPAS